MSSKHDGWGYTHNRYIYIYILRETYMLIERGNFFICFSLSKRKISCFVYVNFSASSNYSDLQAFLADFFPFKLLLSSYITRTQPQLHKTIWILQISSMVRNLWEFKVSKFNILWIFFIQKVIATTDPITTRHSIISTKFPCSQELLRWNSNSWGKTNLSSD